MEKTRKIRKIAVCLSVSFCREALTIEKELKKLGFKVALPYTAYVMKKNGNFDAALYKTWWKDPKTYKRKAYLMRQHFRKVIKSDAILVVNLEKNGQKDYIGGNTLIEMAIAFHFRKPIFILNEVSKDSLFYEEILGMSPIFLNGNLRSLYEVAPRIR